MNKKIALQKTIIHWIDNWNKVLRKADIDISRGTCELCQHHNPSNSLKKCLNCPLYIYKFGCISIREDGLVDLSNKDFSSPHADIVNGFRRFYFMYATQEQKGRFVTAVQSMALLLLSIYYSEYGMDDSFLEELTNEY